MYQIPDLLSSLQDVLCSEVNINTVFYSTPRPIMPMYFEKDA